MNNWDGAHHLAHLSDEDRQFITHLQTHRLPYLDGASTMSLEDLVHYLGVPPAQAPLVRLARAIWLRD